MNNQAMHLSDDKKKEILQNAKTIIIVGLSPDTSKASYHVASFLLEKGYDVIPIYPKGGEILGRKAYTSLKEAFMEMIAKGIQCDIVNIFRKSEALPSVVNEICEIWGLESSIKDSCARQSEIARDLASNYNDQHSVVKLGNLESFNTNNPCIWVQLGLQNAEAAKIARQHGMLYEEDSCIKLEYMRIFSK